MKKYILIFFLILISNQSIAQVYKWVDAQGNSHFGDKKPGQRSVEQLELKTTQPANTEDGEEFANQNTSKKVVMYSTAWCGYCKKARKYFKKNNIQYTEYDIEKSVAAKTRHKRLGGRGVPLILVGRQKMNGFSERRFDQMYR